MKKILFAALLFAGATLGFAKDNAKTENFKTTTTVVKKLSVEANKIENAEKIESVKGICHELVMTKRVRTFSVIDFQTGESVPMVEVTYTFTTYIWAC